jgi:predicted secreted Zn-dependent protease
MLFYRKLQAPLAMRVVLVSATVITALAVSFPAGATEQMRKTLSALLPALSAEARRAEGITVKTKTYGIGGKTGKDLLLSMNRSGPKHGFLSRAIAQTQYKTNWDVKIEVDEGTCRLIYARPSLAITYSYPRPSDNLSPAMRKRWQVFMAGVVKHEEQHGRYAIQMIRTAEKAVAGIRFANDPQCRKAGAEIKRRVARIYENFEAKQVVFDRREHKDNGNIERLIRRLVRN